MASLIYNSAVNDLATGALDFDTDTFKVMLVAAAYTPDKDAHAKRSDVTNEVTGAGYTAEGAATACTVAKDLATDKVTLTFASAAWPASTITAHGGVIYKAHGGAAASDELVAYIDFGADIASANGTFTLGASTITLQN